MSKALTPRIYKDAVRIRYSEGPRRYAQTHRPGPAAIDSAEMQQRQLQQQQLGALRLSDGWAPSLGGMSQLPLVSAKTFGEA